MSDHLTEDQICRAIAGQSTPDEHRHVKTCHECRGDIARSQYAIAAVRHEIWRRAERDLAGVTPSFHTRERTVRRVNTWALAAASVLIASAAFLWQARGTTSDSRDARTTSVGATRGPELAVDIDPANAFYPLQYGGVPVTNGQIVRIAVPRSAPVAFGLDPIELVSARPDAVLADVVIGEDGLARAVRFVRRLSADATTHHLKEPSRK